MATEVVFDGSWLQVLAECGVDCSPQCGHGYFIRRVALLVNRDGEFFEGSEENRRLADAATLMSSWWY